MIQVPPSIQVDAKTHKGNEAAAYLESVVTEHTGDGWEFFRVDELGVRVKPGCLAGLFGQSATLVTYFVVTFRKASG